LQKVKKPKAIIAVHLYGELPYKEMKLKTDGEEAIWYSGYWKISAEGIG